MLDDGVPSAALGELVCQRTEKAVGPKRPEWPYVGLEHIESGSPSLLGTAPSNSSTSTNSIFHLGDVLFGKLRPYLRKSMGASFSGYCSTDILVLRPSEGVDPSFAAKVFQSESVFAEAAATSVGTKMPRTSWASLRRLRVFSPPLREQRRVAEILDTLDEAIRTTEQVIAKLLDMKQGLLHDLLTRGIDEQGELRDPERYPEEFKDSPVGRVPRGWEVRRLSDVTLVTVGYVGPTNPFYTSQREGVLFLRTGNITEDGIRLRDMQWVTKAFHQSHPKSALHPGDVVVSRVGYTGTASVVPDLGPVNCANMIIIRPTTAVSPDWVRRMFGGAVYLRQVRGFTAGSAQPVLNIRLVERLLTPVPDRAEQDAIEEAIQCVDSRVAGERAARDTLQELKRGLMDDLLTGRVRVAVPQEANA